MVGMMFAFSSLWELGQMVILLRRDRLRIWMRRGYELFDEVHLLTLESIIENRLLFLCEDGVGSRSECQCSTEQRLEEHYCRNICNAV